MITKLTFLGSVKSNNYMAKFYFSPGQFTKSGKGGKIVEFNLGNGLKTTNTNEMATSLLKRDYPEIASFKTGQNVGMIFVPENYIPPNPRVVDTNQKFEDLNKDHLDPKDKDKYQGQFRQAPGDAAEREVYQGLQQCFKGKKENGLVIVGLDIGKSY